MADNGTLPLTCPNNTTELDLDINTSQTVMIVPRGDHIGGGPAVWMIGCCWPSPVYLAGIKGDNSSIAPCWQYCAIPPATNASETVSQSISELMTCIYKTSANYSDQPQTSLLLQGAGARLGAANGGLAGLMVLLVVLWSSIM